MKKLAIIASVILILLIGGFILLSANVNSLLATLKPELEARASQAIGAPVALKTVSASVFPSVRLSLEGIEVGEGKGELLSLEKAQVALDVLPLLKKQVSISEVVLVEPVLTLEKVSGRVRVTGLPRRQTTVQERGEAKAQGETKSPQTFNLDSITIKNGSVTFRDNERGRTFQMDNIDATASVKGEGSRYEVGSGKAQATIAKIGVVNVTTTGLTVDTEQGIADGTFDVKTSSGKVSTELALSQGYNVGTAHLLSSAFDLEPLLPMLKELDGTEPLQGVRGKLTGDVNLELFKERRPRMSGELSLEDAALHWGEFKVEELSTRGVLSSHTEREELLLHPFDAKVVLTKLSDDAIALSLPNTSLELRTLHLSVPQGVAKIKGDEAGVSAEVDIPQKRGSYTLSSPKITEATLATFAPALRTLKVKGALAPTLKGSFGPGEWSARGDVGIAEGSAATGGQEFTDVNGVVVINGGDKGLSLESDNLTLVMNGEPLSLETSTLYSQDVVKVRSLHGSLLGGTGELKGSTHLVLNEFDAAASFQELQMSSLFSLLKLGTTRVKGTISRFDGRLKGELGPLLKTTLKGPAELQIKKSELEGVNIAREVLKEIESLPLMEGQVLARVPGEFLPVIEAESTRIDSLNSRVFFEGGKARIDDIEIQSELFSLKGTGEASLLDGFVRLDSTLRFSRAFSESLAAKVKEAKRVLDAEGTLAVPLAITGVPPKVVVVPDIKRLVELGARKVFEEKASDLLEQALGGRREEGEKPKLKDLFNSLRGK